MRLSSDRLRTYQKLGLMNLVSVAVYRWRLRSGHFVKSMPIEGWVERENGSLLPEAEGLLEADAPYSVRFFNDQHFDQSSPPDWFLNPYSQTRLAENQLHWSSMSDFNLDTGDVKTLWELSRFDWLIKACWQIREGNEAQLPVNKWLDDWCDLNPANQGVNWKCAQEASIRAMNLFLAQAILRRESGTSNSRFSEFLLAHVQRILPTVSYAKAQDNNHGTSEAAALFVLGVALAQSSGQNNMQLANRAASEGRLLLEERVAKLIQDDGLFSQYSVNYHRMMLDTLSFAESVRRQFGAPAFSGRFYSKAKSATQWLLAVTDPVSGDAPNIGTNDGSLLFNFKDVDFRDFRPSGEIASTLFLGRSVFPNNRHGLMEVFSVESAGNQLTEVARNSVSSEPARMHLELTCGFKRTGNARTFAILKVPHDRFRPSQADALHIDLWHNGENVLRDAGTYSYNPPSSFNSDLGDTCFHSTVEIDGRNQMRKISRFLYSDWLSQSSGQKMYSGAVAGYAEIQGSYTDHMGATHRRQVSFDGTEFTVVDEISGCSSGAILRFRLSPGGWKHEKNAALSTNVKVNVSGSGITATSLVQSVESRYYLRLSEVPVFEVSLSGDSVTTTKLRLLNPCS